VVPGAQNNAMAHANGPGRAARAVSSFAIAVTTALFVFAAPTGGQAQSCVGTIGPCFQGLGFLDATSPSSTAQGISPDGSTVVGFSYYNSSIYSEAFVWSGGAMTGLGFLVPSCPNPNPSYLTCNSAAAAINGQGIIVGTGFAPATNGTPLDQPDEAFISSGGSMTGLGYLSTSYPAEESQAFAIAGQADVPVGSSVSGTNSQSNSITEAVTFQSGAPVGLGFLATGNSEFSEARGVNANGQVIVGDSINANGIYQAFTWQGGSMTALTSPYVDSASYAYGVSAAGSVVVGYVGNQSQAVRWVNGTPSLLSGIAAAYGVSANGNVLVGFSIPSSTPVAVRWTPAPGSQSIQSLLTAAGVSVSGWTLTNALGVSADGTTITGIGTDPNGHTQAWIARLPAPGGSLTDTHDFNDDGYSDILWRDTGGEVAAWLMNGGTVSQSAGISTLPSSFSIIGQHDFNGDGNADVLWRDASGNVSMWFMNGTAVSSAAGVGNLTSNWTLYGTADLNGDGKGDLLWRDSNTGTVAVWFMNGATVASTAVFGALPSTWTILGDANGEILWRDTAGDIALWGVQNGHVTSSSGLGTVTSNFVVQGVGDFNGDGKIDILWRDTNSGTLSIWFTNGTQVASAAVVSTLPSNWSVAQVGDYDGDGKSDILLLDSAGDLAAWLMNGAAVSSSVGIGNVGTTWQVQNVNAN